jgi:hypothetical protein
VQAYEHVLLLGYNRNSEREGEREGEEEGRRKGSRSETVETHKILRTDKKVK